MPLRHQPVQRKIMILMLLTCAVVLLLMCGAYMILELNTYKKSAKEHLATLAEVIATNSSASLAFESEKDAIETLNALKAESSVKAACLYKSDGSIFAKYPSGIPDSEFPETPYQVSRFVFDDQHLQGFQPVKQDGIMLGTLYIKSDLEEIYLQLRQFALLGLLLMAGSLVIAYFLSRALQKSISEPILSLEHTAKFISDKGDYSVRARKHGNDEVGALTDAFNIMLNRIQAQNKEITSFNQKLEQKVNQRTNDLKQQKEFVETIINASVDTITVLDAELNIIMINKSFERYYGLTAAHVIGRKIIEIFPGMESSGAMLSIHKAFSGEIIHSEKIQPEGINKFFETYHIPLKNQAGNVYGVLIIGHDVTAILEGQRQLELLNAELVKSNRDLEQFAYIASHDLQEPLRKIQTFTQLLAENFNNKERFDNYQLKITQSASRMQQLIQDVLNFSRISNMSEAFVPTDLNELLGNLKLDFELLMRERNVTLIHDSLPVINGIPLQLSQLFSNLISNAIKYSESDPSIRITVEELDEHSIKQFAKLSGADRYYLIRFIDNGIGFDPQYNEQIFAIFQRLHGRKTYSGTGIGLALCRKIVENHHGVIFADSRPGRGAVFSIILPA